MLLRLKEHSWLRIEQHIALAWRCAVSFYVLLLCLSQHLEDTLTSSVWHWCCQEFAMNAIQTWRRVDVAQDAVIPNRGRTPTGEKKSSYPEEGPLLSHGGDFGIKSLTWSRTPPPPILCSEASDVQRLKMIRQKLSLFKYWTHIVEKHRACIGHCFLLVKGISIVQSLSVLLRFTVLIRKTLHCLYVGEGLCGHLVGLRQWILNLTPDSLKRGYENGLSFWQIAHLHTDDSSFAENSCCLCTI